MTTQKTKTSFSTEELGRKLDLVLKRLNTLEAIVLEHPEYAELAAFLRFTRASVDLFADPLKIVTDSQSSENSMKRKPSVQIHAEMSLKARKVKVGEDINLRLRLVNVGKAPISVIKVEEILHSSFELIARPNYCRLEDTYLDMKGKILSPLMTEEINLTLKSYEKGMFTIKPKIIYMDATGHQMFYEPEQVTIDVSETVLPGRISTGYRYLDSLLFGGIPANYAVILASLSCDEKDSLIKSFLNAGVKRGEITFHITIDAIGVKTFAYEFQSNFYLFICNPRANAIIENLPNVFKLKGVENLTDISIELSKAFRRLDASSTGPRRVCIEIVSDVLLQHNAVQTRRWLTDIVTEFKSRGFTILAMVNPRMHSLQEVHAILSLFDGEINISEKESETGLRRFLKIKRMYGQKYLERELRLSK